MNKKEIIILAAIGAGVYILSQVKAMKTYIAPQYAKTAAEKVAEEENEHIRERTPLTPAVPMPRRIAEEIPDAATPAARRRMAEKIAIRKRTAKKIAEKIGKTVAEKILEAKRLRKIPLLRSTRRIARPISHMQAIRDRITRAAARKKAQREAAARKLFPGAERSRIIPYSESSRHSYYGPKSHRLQNEGYGKGKAERDRKQALEFRLNELRALFPSSNL